MTRGEDLARQGWTRRNTIDEPRLSELVRTYEQTGFEVHIEPFDPAEADVCDECMRAQPERYKTIYTRPRAGGGVGELDDLY